MGCTFGMGLLVAVDTVVHKVHDMFAHTLWLYDLYIMVERHVRISRPWPSTHYSEPSVLTVYWNMRLRRSRNCARIVSCVFRGAGSRAYASRSPSSASSLSTCALRPRVVTLAVVSVWIVVSKYGRRSSYVSENRTIFTSAQIVHYPSPH